MQAGPVHRQAHHQQAHGSAQGLLGGGCAQAQQLLQQCHQLQHIILRGLCGILTAAMLLLLLGCLCVLLLL
jgi:hypothetical protein